MLRGLEPLCCIVGCESCNSAFEGFLVTCANNICRLVVAYGKSYVNGLLHLHITFEKGSCICKSHLQACGSIWEIICECGLLHLYITFGKVLAFVNHICRLVVAYGNSFVSYIVAFVNSL